MAASVLFLLPHSWAGDGGPWGAVRHNRGIVVVYIRAPSPVAQYGFTIAAVALATLARFALARFIGEGVGFMLYYPAIVVAAWIGGLWPGLLATALSADLAWYFFVPPDLSLATADETVPGRLIAFVVAGALISFTAESLHRARRSVAVSKAKEREPRAAVFVEHRRNEQELAESRERLRMAMEAGHMGSWTSTLDGTRRVQWSAELEHLFGFKEGQFPGTEEAFFDLVHPDDRGRLHRAVREAIETKTDYEAEFRCTRKDGRQRSMIERGRASYDASGKPLRLAGIVWDVTERKRAEDRFRLAIEGSPIANVMADRAGKIVLVNPQTERLFGYGRGELIGQAVEMLIPQRVRARHPHYRAEFGDAPQARPMGAGRDLYGLRKDGSEVPIEIGLRPIEIGGEALVLSAIVDLTERKRAERALTEAARQHEALYDFLARLQRAESFAEIYDAGLDAMLNGLGCDRASILLYDDHKVMRFVASRGLSDSYRRAVEGHSPWTPDEPNPQPVTEPDVEASALDAHLKALLEREGLRALAFIPLVIGGKLGGKFMAYYNAPHVFTRTELELSLSIARQLSLGIERKRAEEGLKEADRHKDEFLAILSHELRNPLAALTTAAQVLKLTAYDGKKAKDACEVITRQTDLMTHLIEDLLDVSRVTMGKLSLDRAPLNLADVVSRIVDSWRAAGRLDGVRISLTVAPVWIDADRLRIEQIFANLLDNAFKFTPSDRQVAVHVEAKNGEAVLTVADEGEGIAPGLIETVFEPFVQAMPLQRNRGGLGLGLALVKRLTQLHGGTVVVASEGPGRGAVFTVRLPSVANPELRAEASAVISPAGGRRILIVDDNDDARRMLEAVLALDGHRVQGVRDGASGLALAADSPPEVALIDIGLPDIDGYELARRLRATPAGRRITLIALTGFGQAEDQRRAFAAGFDAHLTKPVAPDRLARTIAQL